MLDSRGEEREREGSSAEWSRKDGTRSGKKEWDAGGGGEDGGYWDMETEGEGWGSGWREARRMERRRGRRQSQDGGMSTERERDRVRVGDGGVRCSFPGDRALPALRGRRHDNQHGCRCHSFIALLSIPSLILLFPSLFHSVFVFFCLVTSVASFIHSFFLSHSLFSDCALFYLLFLRLYPPAASSLFLLFLLFHYNKFKNISREKTFTAACVCVCLCAITGL